MKLKNHDYLLTSNIIMTGILQIYYFNILGLISVILSITYLCILFFISFRSRILIILYVLSTVTGVVYYLINPIFLNRDISWASIYPAILLLIQIFHAITMPIIKRNSFFGVKTPLALKNDEIWKKVNNAGSIICYITLFPLYIMIFYLDAFSKISLTIFAILMYAFISLGVALNIEKKYKKEMERQEMIDLQNQRKKESGG